jgi:hypothetical protein
MSEDQHVIHGKIEAPIPLMLRGVPKESALTGAKGELMRSGSRENQVAGAPEDPKVGIGGSGAKDSIVRCGG